MALSVLIIEDDESFQKLLVARLKTIDPVLKVTAFDNISKTREFLQKSKLVFDLVVIDRHLPDGRGTDLLNEGCFEGRAVLAISSDDDPNIPGESLQAGATYFLGKRHISEPLFRPLVQGLIERNRLQSELEKARVDQAVMDSVRTLVGTLRHEINNPLGAVLGAAYLMRSGNVTSEQKEAAGIIESSGKRIKHVLDQLVDAVSLEPIKKGAEKVFHIPGDKPWNNSDDDD